MQDMKTNNGQQDQTEWKLTMTVCKVRYARRHYQRGRCQYGNQCNRKHLNANGTYAPTRAYQPQQPPRRQQEPVTGPKKPDGRADCWHWTSGRTCLKGEACHFKHDPVKHNTDPPNRPPTRVPSTGGGQPAETQSTGGTNNGGGITGASTAAVVCVISLGALLLHVRYCFMCNIVASAILLHLRYCWVCDIVACTILLHLQYCWICDIVASAILLHVRYFVASAILLHLRYCNFGWWSMPVNFRWSCFWYLHFLLSIGIVWRGDDLDRLTRWQLKLIDVVAICIVWLGGSWHRAPIHDESFVCTVALLTTFPLTRICLRVDRSRLSFTARLCVGRRSELRGISLL